MAQSRSELAMRTLTPEQILVIDRLAHAAGAGDGRPYTLARLDDDLSPTPTSEASGELLRLELIGYERDDRNRQTLVAFDDAVKKADRERRRAIKTLAERIAKCDEPRERERLTKMSGLIETPPPRGDDAPRRGPASSANGDGADDPDADSPASSPRPASRPASRPPARPDGDAKAPRRRR